MDSEIDLKALPGDPFEEIRRQKGIVAVTDEVIQRQERERRAMEDRAKWLSMLKSGQGEGFKDEEGEKVELERPSSFGMNSGIIRPEENNTAEEMTSGIKPVEETAPTVDWRAALAQALQELPTEPPKTGSESVSKQNAPKSRKPKKSVSIKAEVTPERLSSNPPKAARIPKDEPPPFPSNPEFPHEQYREAWKEVREYYAKAKDGRSISSVLAENTEPAELADAIQLPNQAVPRREDTPFVPSDISLSAENPEDVKSALEGESLRQLEEAHLIAPKTPSRKRKEVKEVEQKQRRGRPRKNTTSVVA